MEETLTCQWCGATGSLDDFELDEHNGEASGVLTVMGSPTTIRPGTTCAVSCSFWSRRMAARLIQSPKHH